MRTSGQVRAQLEEADRNLSEAVAQLLAGPAHNPGFYQSLQTAANLLSSLTEQYSRHRAGSVSDLVRNLQTNAVRAQRLLDSAAAFYGCAVSPCSSDTVVYTADGALVSQGGN